MIYYTTILGAEVEVEFSARITFAGSPASGPSWTSPGEPAEAMEYELDIEYYSFTADPARTLKIPKYREERILEEMYASSRVYEQIEQQAEEYTHPY